jgi:hypothetical protein
VCALSLDGGETWTDFADGEEHVIRVSEKLVIPAGMIQVKDNAGNITASDQDCVLDKLPDWGGGGYVTPRKDHASDGEQTTTEYNALKLEIGEEPMKELVIGREKLALALTLESAEGFETPRDYEPEFTARLLRWYREPELDAEGNPIPDEDDTPDTLELTVVPEEKLKDVFAYRWDVNASAFKLLGNSDIRYLVLRVGDEIVSLPTEGFTGGTRYVELKMAGVANKKFDYAIRMLFDLTPLPEGQEEEEFVPDEDGVYVDVSRVCDIEIETTVEEETWRLSPLRVGEMYYYDVYVGPSEMLEKPYGAYMTPETPEEE